MMDGMKDLEPMDTEISGFTVIPDKTVSRSKHVLNALPLWWRKPESVTPEVLGEDSIELKSCRFLSEKLKRLLSDKDFVNLFSVQARVVPAVLQNYRYAFLRPRDVCVCTPTGSGKTLAYVVPIVELLQARKRVSLRALIVLPSRTLATQVFSVVKSLSEPLGLKVAVISGTSSLETEQRLLVTMDNKGNCQSNVDIVVATPGRLVDHLYNTAGFDVTDLRILVIDEADLMLAEGCQDWYQTLERSIYGVSADEGGRCRPDVSIDSCLNIWGNKDESERPEKSLHKLLFSATLTYNPELQKFYNLWDPQFFSSVSFDAKDKGQNVSSDGAKSETASLEITPGSSTAAFSAPKGLQEYYVRILPKHKPLFLVYLVANLKMDHILVFVNSRSSTERLRLVLAEFESLSVGEVSAKLAIAKRERLLKQFAAGNLQILICTDSISRGMDVENVRCVVSYDAPHSTKDYMHRVGRTARAGGQGTAYTLLFKSQIFPFMRDMKAAGGSKLKEMKFHRSQMRKHWKTYQNALEKLHSVMSR